MVVRMVVAEFASSNGSLLHDALPSHIEVCLISKVSQCLQPDRQALYEKALCIFSVSRLGSLSG